jgi:hypothetical protein
MAASHALPFIEWDERKHKFAVNEDAAEYLARFDGKIGECGMQREP